MEHFRAMENIIFVGNFWKLIINFHFTFRKFEDRLSIILQFFLSFGMRFNSGEQGIKDRNFNITNLVTHSKLNFS